MPIENLLLIELPQYDGRFQFIQSVLHSVETHWYRHFILPKEIVRQVNRIYASFIWHGDSKTAKGAQIS